jgi:putative ABC transport system permease protein
MTDAFYKQAAPTELMGLPTFSTSQTGVRTMKFFRWKQRKDEDLDAEIRSHLDEAIRDRIARGESEEEARLNAQREFGNVGLVKEDTREMWGWAWLERLGQDLRFGLRMLRKNLGFSLVAILTLALGIGANSTIFSFFNGVLLRPLPYQEPERIVLLDEVATKRGGGSLGVSFTNYLDWRAQNQVFSEVGGYHRITFTLTGAGEAEELPGAMASAGLFSLLGVPPLLGRTFTPEEDQRGRGNVVMLGYGVWQRRFGGDPKIVGRTITLVNGAWEVVGVMPPDFKFPAEAEFWIPLTLSTKGWPRTMHGMGALARLKPDVTLEQAQSEMNNIAGRLAEQYPASNEGLDVSVTGLRDHLVKDYRRGLWMVLGGVGFVLLIACANVANLLLARATARQRELAVRAALGAGRWRIARQLLCESLLHGVLGGAAGILLAWLGLDLLLTVLSAELPYWMKFGIDGRVLAFTLAVSLLTSLIFGAAPAWRAARLDVYSVLVARNGIRRQGMRHLLVVAQVALALILLVGAGLMMRSFLRLQQVGLGFNPDNVLTLRVTVPGANYRGSSAPFFHELVERVNTLPGVTKAGAIVALPLTGIDDGWDIGFVTESLPPLTLQQAPRISLGIITPQYFRAMEIPLLTGRAFDDTDTQATPKVAIIDDRLARTHWPNASPLGQRIRIGQADDRADWYTIVGVAGAVQHDQPAVATRPTVYVPNLQKPVGHQTLVVRSSLPPEALLAAIKSVVKEMDAKLPVTHVAIMRDVVAKSIWQPRLYATLFGVFAVVALLLAAVGIYGVMSYAVAARTNEIGIRVALGAQPRDVLRLVVGQGMLLALSGVGLGLFGAGMLTRLMKALLFNVSATDPQTFAGVALLLTLVAFLACWIPARRATKVDPLIALRCE